MHRIFAAILIGAAAAPLAGQRDVIAKLTPRGAAMLRKATASHVGRHLAVLLGDTITYYGVIASATGPIGAIAMGLERARTCVTPR